MTPLRTLLWISRIGALAAVLSLPAPSAGAAPLAFEGSLSIEFPELTTCLQPPPPGGFICGWLLEFRAEATGVAEIGPGGTIALAGGTFATAGTRYVSDVYGAYVYPAFSIAVSAANGPGVLGATGGVLPLGGVAKICLFADCAAPPPANISIPLSVVGAGGLATHVAAVNVTVVGAPWTAGTITLDPSFEGTVQIAGFAHGPLSGTVSVAAPGGTLSLVTPVAFSTNIDAMAYHEIAYARLTLAFVPEPATALLLAGGLLVLGERARTTLRRRAR